jgi:hypothetical protein
MGVRKIIILSANEGELGDEVMDEVVDEVDETDTLDVTAGAMQLQALLILELESSQLAKNAGNPAVAVMT